MKSRKENTVDKKINRELNVVKGDILPQLRWQFENSSRGRRKIGLTYEPITPKDQQRFKQVRPDFEAEDNAAYFYGELCDAKLVMNETGEWILNEDWILSLTADADFVRKWEKVKTNCVVLSEDQFYALTAKDLENNGEKNDWYNFEGIDEQFDAYGFCPDTPKNLNSSKSTKWMDDARMLRFQQTPVLEPGAKSSPPQVQEPGEKSSPPQVQQEFEGPNSEYMLRPGIYFAVLMELPAGMTGVISRDRILDSY